MPSTQATDTSDPWTADDVASRLKEAVNTLILLPSAQKVSRIGSIWPVLPSTPERARLGYGYDAPKVKRRQATPGEIDRMDEATRWMLVYCHEAIAVEAGLPPDTNRVLWCRALGVTYADIMDLRRQRWGPGRSKTGRSPVPGGNSYRSVWLINKRGLVYMAEILTVAGEPRVVGDGPPGMTSRSNSHAMGSA